MYIHFYDVIRQNPLGIKQNPILSPAAARRELYILCVCETVARNVQSIKKK